MKKQDDSRLILYFLRTVKPLFWREARPSKNAGFTLIEILITVFIFSLAFTATSYILINNLRSANAIRDNFIASGLAQEGMEVVRNIRDRDWFLGNVFGTLIPDGAYRVQWNSQSLMPLSPDPYLKKDDTTKVFSYDTGNDVVFKRTITITTVTVNVEKKIVVTVSWTGRGGTIKTLSAEEHLFNWK